MFVPPLIAPPLPARARAAAPQFFGRFDQLLRSPNYVTRRQSLKLLGDLLLDRTHVVSAARGVQHTTPSAEAGAVALGSLSPPPPPPRV